MHDAPSPIDMTTQPSGILGSNHAGMRAHNERLVLTLIRQHGPTAKADIARLTGLSAQTVSVIMRKLEADGLLVRGDPVRGRVGQPSVPMHLAPRGALFFGLKVGRRSTELLLTDFLGQVLYRRRRVHSYPEPTATVAFTHSAIAEISGDLTEAEQARIAGLGIAIPYFLWNWEETMGVPADKMAVWREADIRKEIASHYRFPVLLENDASAACGAELVFGRNQGPRDFLYFYVGYFIGGGVVLHGRLYTGRTGNAGALGTMPVALPGAQTQQLIDVASLSILENRLRVAGHNTDVMWEQSEAWPMDRAILESWIDEAARGIAQAIAGACAVIDFAQARIDGWIPKALRRDLVNAVSLHFGTLNLTGLSRPDLLEGQIGPDARALGAASLPLSERYLVDQTAFQ